MCVWFFFSFCVDTTPSTFFSSEVSLPLQSGAGGYGKGTQVREVYCNTIVEAVPALLQEPAWGKIAMLLCCSSVSPLLQHAGKMSLVQLVCCIWAIVIHLS